jgi:hypothetical protein
VSEHLRILVLDEGEGTGELYIACTVHDLPAPFDDVLAAYEAMDHRPSRRSSSIGR